MVLERWINKHLIIVVILPGVGKYWLTATVPVVRQCELGGGGGGRGGKK